MRHRVASRGRIPQPLINGELWAQIEPLLPAKVGVSDMPAGATVQSAGTHRHSVCVAVRRPLGNVAQGDGVRFGHDVLATAEILVAPRRLGLIARRITGEALRSRTTRPRARAQEKARNKNDPSRRIHAPTRIMDMCRLRPPISRNGPAGGNAHVAT